MALSIIYCKQCGYPLAWSPSDLKGSNVQHETADGVIHKDFEIIFSEEMEKVDPNDMESIRVLLASHLERNIEDIPDKPIEHSKSVPVIKKGL